MLRLVLIGAVAALTASALPAVAAEPAGHGHQPKYAGEQARPIKSLSADDIAELRRGGGWGLAKPAELNGVPGPAHLLELKDAIPLDTAQVARIEALFATMQAQAIAAGERLIGLEAKLEALFRDRTVDEASLRAVLGEIEAARRELRFVHLSAHLATPAILSAGQIARYNDLRGYTKAADPCTRVPAGHDPAVWRRHNGCG